MCQRAKQVSQNVNCAYSFIPAPFLLPFFSPKLFYNNWRCEETAGRGLHLENFGVKTEEMEQVCVFSFMCCFLMYFRSLISLSVKYSTALYISSFIPFIFTLFCLYLQRKDNLLSRPCNAISHSLVPAENARAPARPCSQRQLL